MGLQPHQEPRRGRRRPRTDGQPRVGLVVGRLADLEPVDRVVAAVLEDVVEHPGQDARSRSGGRVPRRSRCARSWSSCDCRRQRLDDCSVVRAGVVGGRSFIRATSVTKPAMNADQRQQPDPPVERQAEPARPSTSSSGPPSAPAQAKRVDGVDLRQRRRGRRLEVVVRVVGARRAAARRVAVAQLLERRVRPEAAGRSSRTTVVVRGLAGPPPAGASGRSSLAGHRGTVVGAGVEVEVGDDAGPAPSSSRDLARGSGRSTVAGLARGGGCRPTRCRSGRPGSTVSP